MECGAHAIGIQAVDCPAPFVHDVLYGHAIGDAFG
jgi:hypothetical protein